MAIGVEKQRNTSWLISYGDTVTLLICLLITIVVVLQGQSEKDIEWVAEQVQIISDNFRKDYPDTSTIKIYNRASDFKITLTGNSFPDCIDTLRGEMRSIIQNIGKDLLFNMQYLDTIFKPDFIEGELMVEVIIEGHTDNNAFTDGCRRKNKDIKNNWQLSGARAYQTMKVLTNNPLVKENLFKYKNNVSIRGYAETRPLNKLTNWDENRRVEILFNSFILEKSQESVSASS